MDNKERLTSDLLVSISGVLMFLSIAYWIDLDGYVSLAPLLIALGVAMLLWSKPFLEILKPIGFISKPIVLTISHILIFIGTKTYFNQYINNYWLIYLVLGIILLNNSQYIAQKIFPRGS